MLTQVRKALGWGEPNQIHKWYAARNGKYFGYGSTPWCDMTMTWAAYHSGNHAVVCPRGDRAYTVWHAQDFERLGQGWAGTVEGCKKAKPGDIVFIDWNGSNSIGAIDHVGIVERNLGGGRLQTIEGNTANVCARRVRDASVVAYICRPKYPADPAPKPPAQKPGRYFKGKRVTVPPGDPVLRRGVRRVRVAQLQDALNTIRGARLAVDGDFGPKTEAAVKAFQRHAKLVVDGEYGPKSAAALLKMTSTSKS